MPQVPPATQSDAQAFCDLCQWVYECWITHSHLFDRLPERLQEERNVPVEEFVETAYGRCLYRLNEFRQQYSILQIAKLHDPARQGGNEITKGLVGKLTALRKSVGDDLAEEVFAKWLERDAASRAKSKPDLVVMKIVEALAGFENDPKFNLGNHWYTLRRAKGKGASGFIEHKNEGADKAETQFSEVEFEPPRHEETTAKPEPATQ